MAQIYQKREAQGAFSPLPGTIAGFVATLPMTIFLLIVQRLLPRWHQYALPPEKMTEEMAKRTGTDKYLDKPRLVGSSIVAHFGYGAAMGALYTTLTQQVKLPPLLKGTLFGIIIWAASYLGWMPLANISVAATREPVRRNMMMILAHVVWGSVTGAIADRLQQ